MAGSVGMVMKKAGNITRYWNGFGRAVGVCGDCEVD